MEKNRSIKIQKIIHKLTFILILYIILKTKIILKYVNGILFIIKLILLIYNFYLKI